MKTSIFFGLSFFITLSAPLKILSRETAFLFLAVQLGAVYGTYLGFSLSIENSKRQQQNDQKDAWSMFDQQTTIEVGFIMLSILLGVQSVQRQSATLMSLGYILHGLWDILHHFTFNKINVPRWYIPFCAVYDILLGTFIYLAL